MKNREIDPKERLANLEKLAIRGAIVAIMTRNNSHNIGRHAGRA